ncbi:MAG TPA: carboxypeptidase regulatory-like domain-containing protein, partial [Candidatus Acidoferrales bacterium]|nr:carboxypeptidase regulatory-like domain-containing protein [Candidatus Acidoferrales bacterium]
MAILLCTVRVFAQGGTSEQRPPSAGSVGGKLTSVTGQKVAEILAGVAVKLTSNAAGSAPRTTLTDFEGRFEFAHLLPGTYTLETRIEGFQPSTQAINLAPNEILIRDIVLQITSVEQRIEVQGEATEIATQSVSATATVTEQQLEDLPLQKQEFIEALAMSPSVIRTQEGKLNFNGQAESQGMLLVDSAENVDPVSGSFAIPVPVNTIQNIQVFTTPDSSAYGGFSGGLTRIDIRPPIPAWNYKFLDIVPSFRGKHDHLIGLLNMTPGVEFGGPIIKDKLFTFG